MLTRRQRCVLGIFERRLQDLSGEELASLLRSEPDFAQDLAGLAARQGEHELAGRILALAGGDDAGDGGGESNRRNAGRGEPGGYLERSARFTGDGIFRRKPPERVRREGLEEQRAQTARQRRAVASADRLEEESRKARAGSSEGDGIFRRAES